MKKRVFLFALAAFLAFGVFPTALAAEPSLGPSVTWLSGEGEPYVYNRELNWLTCKIDDNNYYVIDLKSQAIVEDFEFVNPFFDGLARVARKNSAGNWRYGYINQSGELIVPLKYEMASYFSEGRALVWSGNKCGYIDTKGSEVIPLTWDAASFFLDDLAWVGKKNTDGSMKYGFIDRTGQIKTPLEWDGASDFSDGLAKVCRKDTDGREKYGYIDKTGAVIVPPEYAVLSDFSEGLAVVRHEFANNCDFGYIDKDGTVVIPLEYDYACDFSEGLAAVRRIDADGTWKWGFIDKTGVEVIPPNSDYNYVALGGSFSDGLIAVGRDNADGTRTWGIINKTGKEVVPFTLTYDNVLGFRDSPFGKLAVTINNNSDKTLNLGCIDPAGREIIPPEWSDFLLLTNEWTLVCKKDAEGNGKWACVDRNGDIISSMEYDEVGFIKEGTLQDNVPTEGEGGMYWVKKGASYGYFEVTEQMRQPITPSTSEITKDTAFLPSSSPVEKKTETSHFPITTVVGGAIAVAGVSVVTLLLVQKRRQAR